MENRLHDQCSVENWGSQTVCRKSSQREKKNEQKKRSSLRERTQEFQVRCMAKECTIAPNVCDKHEIPRRESDRDGDRKMILDEIRMENGMKLRKM